MVFQESFKGMVSEGQDRTGQVWKGQVGSGQVGIGQVRIGQVGAGQVGTSQVGKFYVRTVQIGTTEVGTVEYFESSWILENLELECGPAQPDLLFLLSSSAQAPTQNLLSLSFIKLFHYLIHQSAKPCLILGSDRLTKNQYQIQLTLNLLIDINNKALISITKH